MPAEFQFHALAIGGNDVHARMVSATALVIVFVFLSSLHPRAEAANGEDGHNLVDVLVSDCHHFQESIVLP